MGHRKAIGKTLARHAWQDAFIAGLKEYGTVNRACMAAGITTGPAYSLRKRCAAFDAEWAAALAHFKQAKPVRTIRNAAGKPAPRQWKKDFLDTLAETSNVSASAKRAHIPAREVYKERRDDPEFAAAWRAALYEGYVNLEMEVLGYLRDRQPSHKMDVGNALRLLAAHRETIAKEYAVRENVSAAEVRASIERKVEELRKKVAGRAVRLND